MAIRTQTYPGLDRRTHIAVRPKRWQPALPLVPYSFAVPGLARDVRIQIASNRDDWEQAFQLVADTYQARGYQAGAVCDCRFTPYHALPEAVVLVAKEHGRVIATMSLIPDNTLLGLPMETIYGNEISELRWEFRRLCEAGSLAATALGPREFMLVFTALIRLAWQYHVKGGGDTYVITVNPRHRFFYTKVLGFLPLGGRKALPSVQNHPAEAFMLDVPKMHARAPEMYQTVFGKWLPDEALVAQRMPVELVRHFASRSSQTSASQIDQILRHVERWGGVRRWLPAEEF